jgi:hypothetical protein
MKYEAGMKQKSQQPVVQEKKKVSYKEYLEMKRNEYNKTQVISGSIKDLVRQPGGEILPAVLFYSLLPECKFVNVDVPMPTGIE